MHPDSVGRIPSSVWLVMNQNIFLIENPVQVVVRDESITCTVEGDHLAWFESGVIIEANNDPSIKHIFVQAHVNVPILQSVVRKIDCSGQFMDGEGI